MGHFPVTGGGGGGTITRVQSTDPTTLTVAHPTGPTVTLTALAGAVAQLLAGTNVVLSPATGKGDVTISVPGPVTFAGNMTVRTATEIVLGSTTAAQIIITVATSTVLLRALIAIVIELSGGSASLRMSGGNAALATTGASSTARVEASGTGATARLIGSAYALIEAGLRITLVVNGVTNSLFTYTADPNGHVAPGYQGALCLTPTGLWRAAGVGETTWEKLGTGHYASLIGAGETATPGALTQRGTFTIETAETVTVSASGPITFTTTGTVIDLTASGPTGQVNLSAIKFVSFIVNGASVKFYVYTGDPNGHVTATRIGAVCFDTTTPALWTSTAGGTTSWEKVEGIPLTTKGAKGGVAELSSTGSVLSNVTGAANTATGTTALASNTTGQTNTAAGVGALYSNTTGSTNTATGVRALYSNTTGSTNTATGVRALYSNTTGGDNTATGFGALRNNTTGSANTANGLGALTGNTTGGRNTAFGASAGSGVTTQDNTTSIGATSTAAHTGSTAIGQGATTTADTQIALGTATSQVKISNNTTGSGAPLLGANSPASTLTAPYTWFKMTAADGTTVYVPAWA